MTLAYKVEELLALRDSVSESAVSIDKFADEDVIKEHVLRPSASACLIGSRSDNSSRPLAAPPAAGTTAAGKKPSPSPSIKRGKAERLLKEHGSPPGMRVTAGGRVVPSDLQPLSSARFSANSLRSQPPRVVSPGNLGAVYPGPDTSTDNIPAHSPGLFTNNGQAYLFIDNQLVPINTSYMMTAPYNNGEKGGQPAAGGPFTDPNTLGTMQMQPYLQQAQASAPISQSSAPIAPQRQLDLNNLMKQHASKSQDHKYLEQIEVLRAPYESQEWREATVEKKRKLVIEIDNLRRAIIAMDPNAFKTGTSTHTVPMAPNPAPMNAMPPTQVVLGPQFQQPLQPPMFMPGRLPGMTPELPAQFPKVPYELPARFAKMPYGPPVMMYGQPMFDAHVQAAGSYQMPSALPVVPMNVDMAKSTAQDNVNQSPTSGRRSHAVEIKPPRDAVKANTARGSTLDPKSPTYEPSSKPTFTVKPRSASSFLPQSPSPKPTPDRMFARISSDSMKNVEQTLKPKASLSSVSTGDFFPNNTHEHSLTKTAPAKPSLSEQRSAENLSGPITPDKRARGTPPLTGSGGKSRFLHLFESGSTRPSTSSRVLINSPLGSGKKSRFTTDSPPLHSPLGTGREQSPWFLSQVSKTPIVPSTFQEGYQAGLQHVGLPRDTEVIRGYIDGLKDLLDELAEMDAHSKKPTYQVTSLINATHDSGVSMSFTTGANSAAGQENHRRVSTAAGLLTPIEGLGQSPISSMQSGGKPTKYSLCNESADLPRHSRISKTDSLDKVNEASSKTPMGLENGSDKGQLSNALHTQQHASSNKLYPMQLSGNQAAARGYARQPTSAGKKDPPSGAPKLSNVEPAKSAHEQRYSGFDGAMDNLQEVFESRDVHYGAETNTEASCFKGYSSKGKHKVTSSPTKSAESPKKPGEHSPARAKLEQIAHSFKSNKKDDRKEEKMEDPSIMSPAEKRHWRENWRRRFATMAIREREEISKQEYLRFRNMNQN